VHFGSKKAFITLGSPVVPLLSTSKADSGLASEFRRDRAIYTAYERMLRVWGTSSSYEATDDNATESNTLLERQAKEDKEDKEERWKEERREQLLAWKTARRAALEAPGSSQVSSL